MHFRTCQCARMLVHATGHMFPGMLPLRWRSLTVQLGMALMVNPPKEGSESYEQFEHEETSVMESLRRRAQIMTDGFNACEGVTCTFTEGAMYSFPRLRLPQKVRNCPVADMQDLACPRTPGQLPSPTLLDWIVWYSVIAKASNARRRLHLHRECDIFHSRACA